MTKTLPFENLAQDLAFLSEFLKDAFKKRGPDFAIASACHFTVYIMIEQLRREGRPSVFIRKAKKLLHDAGYVNQNEYARLKGISKQAMTKRVKKIGFGYVIKVGGKTYIKLKNDYDTI